MDLNNITKEDFVNELIINEDFSGFYYPLESKLLSLDFDFEQMKNDFEQWLILNS